MKTTAEIYHQRERIYNLLCEIRKTMILKADPATGGILMLTHNWGNEDSKKIVEQFENRKKKIEHIYQVKYKQAFLKQFTDHLSNKN